MITVAIERDLGSFEGPLDLLLALVRRNQYPLDALPIAEIGRRQICATDILRSSNCCPVETVMRISKLVGYVRVSLTASRSTSGS